MTLERFNHILFSVLGTVALGLCCILGAVLVWELFPSPTTYREPAVEVADTNSEPSATDSAETAAPSPQSDGAPKAAFCTPVRVERSGLLVVPVAEHGAVYEVGGSKFGSGSRRAVSDCSLHGDPPPQNAVAVQDDGTQRFVFQRRVLIEGFEQPARGCDEGHGRTPCDLLLWTVRDTDTNGDDRVTADDGLMLLGTDLEGGNLRRLSPPGSSLSSYLRHGDQLVLMMRVDVDDDGRFEPEDPLQLMTVPTSALVARLPEGYDAKTSPAVPLLEDEITRAAEALFAAGS